MEKISTPEQNVSKEYLTLSKKLKNKLMELFKPFGDTKETESLLENVRLNKYDIYQQSEINKYMPEILSTFFSGKEDIVSIELDDLGASIELIAKKIVEKESFSDVVLSIGMGGSIDTPNVRTPAYIVAAIKTLNSFYEFKEEGKIVGMPKARILKANNLSAQFNEFDLERVEKTTEMTFEFLKQFIRRFFPHLEDSFEFLTDELPTCDFLSELNSQAELLATQATIVEEIANVLKMGEKHGGSVGANNALLYAAAHPFYNHSIARNTDAQPALIIDYGGRPQARFNKISRTLISQNRNNVNYSTPPTVHIITKAGKIPVYYTARDGDLPLSEDFNKIDLLKLDRATHMDYKAIFSIIDQENFEDFVRHFTQNNKQ